jgi:hypothetical protein
MAGHYGYMPRKEGEFIAWIKAIYDQCAARDGLQNGHHLSAASLGT